MKGLERITTVRLAEVISESGLVQTDQITEALYQQDSTGLPFIDFLVDTGVVSEWDLAKQVVDHFQIPFLVATNLEIEDQVVKSLPEDFVFKHSILPFASIGKVLNVMMPVFTPYKVLVEASEKSGLDVFPFVGLGSENRKVLFRVYPEHPKEEPAGVAPQKIEQDSSWESVFDLGDEEVHRALPESE